MCSGVLKPEEAAVHRLLVSCQVSKHACAQYLQLPLLFPEAPSNPNGMSANYCKHQWLWDLTDEQPHGLEQVRPLQRGQCAV